MKGLIAKDFAILRQRGKILLILLIWGVGMNFIMEDSSFVVGWLVMIATITAMSTLSYDEYDNCMPFLMSLPVTRRTYAVEKYAFSALVGTAAWLVSVVLVTVCELVIRKQMPTAENYLSMVLFLAGIMIIPAISIPPQLKWGVEKGRLVMIGIFGAIAVGAFVFSRISADPALIAKLDKLPLGGFVAGTIAVTLVLTAVSVFISVRIMEKKEF